MSDDFDRDVYCLAGLPIDAVDMSSTLSKLKYAAENHTRCFLSTPNLNFIIASRYDTEFRNSVIHSDLVVADGMPLVWMAKMLGIPIRERVAGSSIFEALRTQDAANPLSIYFFGGQDGVAEIAKREINQTKRGLTCVGYQSPGFVTVEQMSAETRIDQINASRADFLVVALGAKKGQSWILKNLSSIKAPIISHLGAVINFGANKLKRAPVFMQNNGLEWLWRIKEEHSLWRRYWHDGLSFLYLLITAVIPHAFWLLLNQRYLNKPTKINSVHLGCAGATYRITVSGLALDPISPGLRSIMRLASLQNADVVLDLTDAEYLSSGFLGIVLILKKHLDNHAVKLRVVGIQPKMERLLKWNGLTDLIR